MAEVIDRWHQLFERHNMDELDEILHDDVVFHSPVVHTPQHGKAIVTRYLSSADQALNSSGHFEYVRKCIGDSEAVLEFKTEIDGVVINGVDMITWDDNNLITDFKVMVRPLKAINAVHAAMGRILAKMQAGAAQQ